MQEYLMARIKELVVVFGNLLDHRVQLGAPAQLSRIRSGAMRKDLLYDVVLSPPYVLQP
jgi:hypothetical protein